MAIQQNENEIKNITTRDATKTEQAALEQALSILPIPRKRYLKAALNTAVFWVFILAGFCILWFISSLVVSAFINIDIGISSIYAQYLFPTMVLAAAIFSINSTRNWLNKTVDEYLLIKTDLTIQKTNVEVYKVIAAICFKEPELGGLLYFLLLQKPGYKKSNKQKIRVIYDYESQNKQVVPVKLLTIKKQMAIYSAPISAYLFENKFEGELVKDITLYDLTLPPAQWPEPDSWQDINWNELKSIYNPQ